MFSLEILHCLDKSVYAFHCHGIVAACTETTYRAMSLYADHSALSSEVEERLLQLFVLIVHHEANVHQ